MKTEEQAARAPRKPRKDKATRRVVLPAWLVKDLEQLAKEGRHSGIEALLNLWADQAAGIPLVRPITLPPSVLARLAPVAAGSGRSISELLGEMEEDLAALLDGQLGRISGEEGLEHLKAPSLEDRLVEAFRARIRAQAPGVPASDPDLVEALRAGMERA